MNSGTMSYDNQSNGQKKSDDDEGAARFSKYKPALKTLLPFRPTSNTTTIPSATTGLLSYVTISWLTTLMWKAFRTGLTKDDLWELHDRDKAETNSKRLHRLWEEEKLKKGKDVASFANVIWQFGKTRFLVCIFLMILTVAFQFLVPAWILQWILEFINNKNEPIETGIALALIILITQTIRNLSFCGLWMIGIHTGIRVEGAMQLMTYEKLLKLRNGGESILAKAITFCTNDQERIFECVAGGVLAVAAPVMFLMSIIYTTIVIGPWALLGNAVIFLFYPILGGVAACTASIRRKTVKQTNARVGLMTEILSAVRIIKLYGWEDSFSLKVEELRNREEKQLRRAAFLQSLTVTVTPMINIIASVVVFLGYTLSGHDLTAAEAFSIFSVFASLQFTVGTLPFAVRSIAEATVCFRNFQRYLELPEYENITTDFPVDHDSVIVIKDGDFAWENINNDIIPPEPPRRRRKKKYDAKTEKNDPELNTENVALADKVEKESEEQNQCLTDIRVDIKRGKLVGISGATGSGKSSLISAILGDVKKLKGDILVRGSLAYVSQQAWIYNDTFQENILFGSPMIKEKYEKVLEVCCLKEDLAMLPDRDRTIIGDRGVNLSGGQKQRLNLARSIYSDRSIYLLDDCLSAVDSVVGKTIFQKCIQEYLADKTVLLVTHSVEFLEKCDEVLFIKDGVIMERGKHEELIKLKHDYYHLCQFTQRDEKLRRNSESPVKEVSKPDVNGSTGQLPDILTPVVQEEIRYKDAGWKSYMSFVNAGGGWLVGIVVFILLLLFGAIRIFTTVYIQFWIDSGDGLLKERKDNMTLMEQMKLNETSDGNGTEYMKPITLNISDHELKGSITDNPQLGLHQGIIAVSVALAYIIGVFKGLATTRFVLRAGTNLHNNMFARIMKCPLSFFDTNPQGRIVNRFSKDMDELDARLPFFFEFVTQAMIYIFATIVVVCFIFPMLSVAMLVIFAVMVFFGSWLTIGVKQTKELDNSLKSPVVGHIQSSMYGRTIIRTFNRQAVFQKRFSEHVNRHLSAEAVFRIANRWFTVRMDVIGLIAIFSTVLFGVLTRNEISPAQLGLAFSMIYTVSTFVPFVFRLLSELNARFTSVERILEYGESLETEIEPEKPAEPDENWPKQGEITFDSVTMRYRTDLPIVLHGISFEIKGGEKIGIIGRTGAGKSSIVACLLHLNDLDSGKIIIDSIDTSQILRKKLRQSIAVIPQDPVLFKGSLRYNVDPFNKYTDEEICDALEKSHLKNKISKLKKGLLTEVDSEGSNFSVGEKQLICLTRSILRKNKILVLDEATSSIDVETDALIQETIKTTFVDCTVLTIAHRLNTITSYDRVIVLDKGQIVEFDTPGNLMKSQGLFYNMMKAAGISSIDQTSSSSDQAHIQVTSE